MAGVERRAGRGRGSGTFLTVATSLALVSPDIGKAIMSPASPAAPDNSAIIRRFDSPHQGSVRLAAAASPAEVTQHNQTGSVDALHSGKTLVEPIYPNRSEIPEYFDGRQKRVTRDFTDFKTGNSAAVMALFEQAETENRELIFTDGPRDSQRATYRVFFPGERDPLKKVGSWNGYFVTTTVLLDPNGNPRADRSYDVSIEATSNKFGRYRIRFNQDPASGTSGGIVEVSRKNIGDKEEQIATYSANIDDLQNHQTLQWLDRRKFDGFTELFKSMLSQARSGTEVVSIPTLEELAATDTEPITMFSKVAKDGDTTWNIVADQVTPKWEGQEQVVAAIATEFLSQQRSNPRWIFQGDTVTLSGLTKVQKQIIEDAAAAPTLEAYAAGPEQAFAAAIGNAN